MSGGSNGPEVIVNGGSNDYDRDICFDAPVAFDTGIYVYPNKTLAQLRADMMALLGFAAMAASPPPGMSALLTLWLQLAQSQQYYRYSCLRTERWWGWQLSEGKRFYDVPIDCTKALNFRRITGAYIADNGGIPILPWQSTTAFALNDYVHALGNARDLVFKVTTAGTTSGTEPTWPTEAGDTVVDGTVTFTATLPPDTSWHPLRQGIDPLCFTSMDQSMPSNFEVREYLEVWPPPEQPYVVWLKGHMGLRRFTEDADECTIDHEIVLLYAAAMGKAHYRQPDANNYAQMTARMSAELTNASHGITRYVPKPATTGMKPEFRVDDGPWPQPRATWRTN